MSAPDQEEVTERPVPELVSGARSEARSGVTAELAADADADADAVADDLDGPGADGHDDSALTPRQARRVRVVVASVLLVAMATLLAVRFANRSSVLVVGLYGFAMILCGVVIELSRHGRTRLATWVLGFGLAGTLATDWLLLP
ncbi:hypothetical protein P3L51_31805 [Streptomyces sp. PSRA5]|uniref:hypothetical protein n=1 Tax=Streptomyces panacea TaxID=3035064 RepID=UPI00339CE2EC